VPAPSRTLSGDAIASVKPLAGMAYDPGYDNLYLLGSNGTGVRVTAAHSASGSISGSSNVVRFSLTPATNCSFGQIAVDPSGKYLYISETDGGSSNNHVLVITNPNAIVDNVSPSTSEIIDSNDYPARGVAAGSAGAVFGYYSSGKSISDPWGTAYYGARLRYGTNTLSGSKVLIGNSTMLGNVTSTKAPMAYDNSNNKLFVAGSPILVFSTGTFSPGYNTGPEKTLENSKSITGLSILAHASSQDWLVGGDGSSSSVWIWQTPLDDPTPTQVTLTSGTAGSSLTITGLALDGSHG
jgi:hypothetical protein